MARRSDRQRVVVVTGGGGGIGAAIAEEVGRRGVFVVTMDPLVSLDGSEQLPTPEETTAGRIVAAGGSARASSVSVTDRDAVRDLFVELADELGGVDGRPYAGADLQFDFPRLIAHAAKTRSLGAGSIIGSGTVSNVDPAVGFACIAERRAVETVELGAPRTPFLAHGDRVRIEAVASDGSSPFGAIDQEVARTSGGVRTTVAL